MKSYLIVGLGNIGREYAGTRHNIGFDVLDFLAAKRNVIFQTARYAETTSFTLKGRKIVLVKPSTYMNLSGKAVDYWVKQENPEAILIVADDVALPLGTIRIRKKGGAGGHNGLENIIVTLGTEEFPRLRFGIGNQYPKGMQVEYVLGNWFPEQIATVRDRLGLASQAIEEFVLAGPDIAMNKYNKLPDPQQDISSENT